MNAQQWEKTRDWIGEQEARYKAAFSDDGWSDAWPWVAFIQCGYAYLGQIGREFRGLSLSQKPDEWLLVLRVWEGDIPQVAFMSDSTTTGCMRKLLGRLERDELVFYRDKFG